MGVEPTSPDLAKGQSPPAACRARRLHVCVRWRTCGFQADDQAPTSSSFSSPGGRRKGFAGPPPYRVRPGIEPGPPPYQSGVLPEAPTRTILNRTKAEAVGLEPTSGAGRHLLSRQAPHPGR